MSDMLDPRDVLTYLNELGYTNINAQQLKEFMKDLKRLIKYEENCNQYVHEEEPHCPCQQQEEEEEEDEEAQEHQCCPNRDVFHILHNKETVASLGKKKSQKETRTHKDHVFSIQINKRCGQHMVPAINCTQPESIQTEHCNSYHKHDAETATGSSHTVTVDEVATATSMPTTSKSCPSLPLTGTSLAEKKKLRPKSARSSFIRPKVIAKPLKSDPVALYHQYKQEWDKIKFPGEHHHGETRWAVREKLLGDRYN